MKQFAGSEGKDKRGCGLHRLLVGLAFVFVASINAFAFGACDGSVCVEYLAYYKTGAMGVWDSGMHFDVETCNSNNMPTSTSGLGGTCTEHTTLTVNRLENCGACTNQECNGPPYFTWKRAGFCTQCAGPEYTIARSFCADENGCGESAPSSWNEGSDDGTDTHPCD